MPSPSLGAPRAPEVLFKNEEDAWDAKVKLEGSRLLGKVLRLESGAQIDVICFRNLRLDCSTEHLDKVGAPDSPPLCCLRPDVET